MTTATRALIALALGYAVGRSGAVLTSPAQAGILFDNLEGVAIVDLNTAEVTSYALTHHLEVADIDEASPSIDVATFEEDICAAEDIGVAMGDTVAGTWWAQRPADVQAAFEIPISLICP